MPLQLPKLFRPLRQRIFRALRWGLPALLILILGSHLMVRWRAAPHVYESLEDLPHYKVALVLGTSRRLSNGRSNLYYRYRIDAAVELYHAGKCDYLLVSGDNRRVGYNEPGDMRKDLEQRGVPSERIVEDFAGFRTLDSMIRARRIFGQRQLIVISQRFHVERAVLIGRYHGIETVGYPAGEVGFRLGLKTRLREYLARVKMLIDLYIFAEVPHFLGDRIQIGDE